MRVHLFYTGAKYPIYWLSPNIEYFSVYNNYQDYTDTLVDVRAYEQYSTNSHSSS